MPSRRVRNPSESRQREFVRQFVEDACSFDMEVASMPRPEHSSFVIPISGSRTGGAKPLAVGIQLQKSAELGKIVFISGEGVLISRSFRPKLLRLNRILIRRWRAFDILFSTDGPIHRPVVWKVRLAKPSDFRYGLGKDLAPSISIEAAGTWEERKKKYTVHYSLALEAEPSPRVYLLVSIDDSLGNIWRAYSQWVPLTGAGWHPDPKILLGGKDGEARNQS